MTDRSVELDSSLSDFLATRARGSTDTRLAIDVAGGLVVAIIAAVWRGPGWHLIASASLCFLGYGAWGIADRELNERAAAGESRLSVLRAARIAATVLGVIAALALVLGGLFVLLGTIKS